MNNTIQQILFIICLIKYNLASLKKYFMLSFISSDNSKLIQMKLCFIIVDLKIFWQLYFSHTESNNNSLKTFWIARRKDKKNCWKLLLCGPWYQTTNYCSWCWLGRATTNVKQQQGGGEWRGAIDWVRKLTARTASGSTRRWSKATPWTLTAPCRDILSLKSSTQSAY